MPDSANMTDSLPQAPGTSLRVKLTLWMVAIYLAVQLSFGLVMQLYFVRSIHTIFNARMILATRRLADDIRPLLPAISEEQMRAAIRKTYGVVASDDYVLDVFSEVGRLVATSRSPGPSIHPELLDRQLRTDEPEVMMLPGSILRSGNPRQPDARVMFLPMAGPENARYLLVASRKDHSAHQMVSLLWQIMLLSIPIGLLATGISSYLVAGLAVRPLRRLTTMARGLRPESIKTQIPSEGESAEVTTLQRELELARQRIESGFAVQERFMSNVSHELKTPMAVALTQIQLLKVDTLPAPAQETIRSITDELYKLSRMVDSFLMLTRVRHGKAIVAISEHCHVRDVMMDSYQSCLPFAKQYRVRVHLHLPDEEHVDVSVHGNCDLLRTVLDNLIRNAIRFSPEGQVVSVRAEIAETSVFIKVRDRGPGIAPEILPRIFDRFLQSKDEERRGRGHGLGLAIAQGIAELHAGTLSGKNCEDGGCEFMLTLPLKVPDEPRRSAAVGDAEQG